MRARRASAGAAGLERARAAAWFCAGLAFLLAAGGWTRGSALALALIAGTTSAALLCFAFGGAVLSGRPIAQRLGWTPARLSWPVHVGLVLGLLAVSQLVEWAIALVGYGDVGTLAEFRGTMAGVPARALLPVLVGLALLPAFGEELALRGWIQRGLAPRLGAPLAVVLASALFGLLHGDVVHAAGAFVLGIYLGAVTALADSVRPAVLCHGVNNLLATTTVALGLEAVAPAVVVLGGLAGPWALRRLWLRGRTAHPLRAEAG